uniref:Upstream stimulatory factor 1 n=1 Tax=Dromaius novaehollandiae TaxID=8790 RepID=A0A8C4JGY1_DRONO
LRLRSQTAESSRDGRGHGADPRRCSGHRGGSHQCRHCQHPVRSYLPRPQHQVCLSHRKRRDAGDVQGDPSGRRAAGRADGGHQCHQRVPGGTVHDTGRRRELRCPQPRPKLPPGQDGAFSFACPPLPVVTRGPLSLPRPLQAVIQGAFTSEDAVETEATATETHYTYFPTTAVADTSTSAGAGTTATAVVTTQNSEALLGQPTPTGQFFVMMSPQEVLQGGAQRSIAPRTHPYSPKSEAPRTTRDEKRRAQHNEVERRRRDKINNWIVQLSKIIPDCSMENTKSGQSKGGILSKACDYIQELRQSNHRLSEELQGLDQLQMDNEVLRQQVEDLKNKNLILRAQLRQHGVEIVIKNDSH